MAYIALHPPLSSGLSVRLVVNIHIEVVAKRETKAINEDVCITSDERREHRLPRPRGATVGRGPVIDIPMRLVPLVHPRDPNSQRFWKKIKRRRDGSPPSSKAREISLCRGGLA
jgi:hypothetical protein